MSNDNKSFFERLNAWIRNSITIKLVSIGILILLLLIPAFMVEDLIREREYTSEGAISEVSSKWGEMQILSGPVINIPYKKYYKKDNEIIETTEYAHFLPDELNISGKVLPEKRYRGIYEVVVYTAQLNVSGKFPQPSFSEWNVEARDILWKDAFLSVGITDMRGIRDRISLKWNNSSLDFNPGMGTDIPGYVDEEGYNSAPGSGVSVRVPVASSDSVAKFYDFTFDVNLNGSRQIYFDPLGKETNVDLTSQWSNPSFDGSFLPESREITPDGFKAHWKVLHLNRNFPQAWMGSSYNTSSASFGVNLLVPVDHYQKSTRAAKYAILIITLTFLVFFFVEILNRKRIHPFQYILVGLAICIFYSLLIAISEHLNFNAAYIISGIAVIGAVTAYSLSVFKQKLPTVVLGLIMLIIYGFIFIIIQLQDYALLVGSIGLFIVLAVVMYISRKIDWYSYHIDRNE
jgi:inner membrane protein